MKNFEMDENDVDVQFKECLPLVIHCGKCDRIWEEDTFINSTIKCPKCGQKLRIKMWLEEIE